MLAVTFQQYGDPEVLTLSDIAIPTPKPHDLLIKVHASALNRADISQRRGTYPAPPGHSEILGLEIAGEIAGWGDQVDRNKFPLGMRVFGLVDGGGYAEYCLIDHAMAIPLAKEWSFITAAAIPEAFLTAQVCLFQLGNLKKDETVLIHAGGSGVGTAAIQLAHQIEAKIFITASNEEKIQKCLQLGAHHGINYKEQDFFPVIKKLTDDTGVDIILDPVGQEYFSRNLNLLRSDGRLIQIAKMSGDQAEFSLGRLIVKRIQIKGNTMRSRSLEDKRAINKDFCQYWLPLLQTGKIRPIVDAVFPLNKVIDAHYYLQSNKNFGKVILQML